MHSDTDCMIKAPKCGGGKEADRLDLKTNQEIHQPELKILSKIIDTINYIKYEIKITCFKYRLC